MKTLVFGHKNPDTDTITSAIVYASLKQQMGLDAEAIRLGEVNGETAYALEYFNVEAPRFVERVAEEAKDVILVDHNEPLQSANDIDQVRIVEVVDHHRISGFQTAEPLYYRAEPVGCTATILNKLFKEHGVEVSKVNAGLMLSAIISDSLLFQSPTCTEEDKAAAAELAAIAEVDVNEYGLAMLKAGASLAGKTAKELISIDAKEFSMGVHRVEIAQINTVDVQEVLALRSELLAEMTTSVSEKNLDLFLLVITDIIKSDSTGLVLGLSEDKAAKAFEQNIIDQVIPLPGVVSRKKQVVPVLTEVLG
ncbi:manganese-dependent inorganic pyrophosphatase [Aureibacillus halotolerans]|uniref:Probable manganese-dependent inorganic pyrophosphatase n=1 Tax=Aureibacillus halotolerans TaxID=1508390 RepID=A0A4R6U9Y3_9BACI|nr:manganese-dependent inorganic pyrophosphatase [Aureibacillus halotolerans]TDQ42632.1 manganese-dependent inorganic pyrophosphatase [Aureibacillus halotolerans]